MMNFSLSRTNITPLLRLWVLHNERHARLQIDELLTKHLAETDLIQMPLEDFAGMYQEPPETN